MWLCPLALQVNWSLVFSVKIMITTLVCTCYNTRIAIVWFQHVSIIQENNTCTAPCACSVLVYFWSVPVTANSLIKKPWTWLLNDDWNTLVELTYCSCIRSDCIRFCLIVVYSETHNQYRHNKAKIKNLQKLMQSNLLSNLKKNLLC